jgi:MoaA/NifB/PqqE/SkfB family radical SAM enzyme
MSLTLLYRGASDQCNYDCWYCPFRSSRTSGSAADTERDELARLLAWLRATTERELRLFFTPKGEALIRPAVRHAIRDICRLEQVSKVAVQTNLSWDLEWLDDPAVQGKLALWCSYHPPHVSRAEFVARCLSLRERGIAFSAGMVGIKENIPEATALRAALPRDVYLWINAYKHGEDYYDPADVARMTEIDPLFPFSQRPHPSLGMACDCGDSVLAVHGDGTVQRCWFCPAPLGNLFDGSCRRDRSPCPNHECRCHIGYVHAPGLPVHAHFGEGILERIPSEGGWHR